MNIAVFGLGYVGCVSAACFAKLGHSVVGVDVNPVKVEMINAGKSPIIEQDIDQIIAEAAAAGSLRAVTSADEAVASADVSLICVGTPSDESGGLNLVYIRRVCEEIGAVLAKKQQYHVVAIRSTVLPGTLETVVKPILEQSSGLKVGEHIGLCSNPEFLREGSAVRDFFGPPYTLIGQSDERAGDTLSQLYASLQAPLVRTEIKTSEMVKYANNAYHALKITFANEIGSFCKTAGVDSHRVMEIFKMDNKLNISGAYLKPGFSFGGSCLGKDLRAMLHRARHTDLDLPLMQAIIRSNQAQTQRAVDMVLKKGKKKIGVLGLSFKAGTDDLRESPMVDLIEALLGKGYDIRIYDANVSLARLFGANKAYIEHAIPHISSLLCNSLEELGEHAEVLVVGYNAPEFLPLIRQPGRQVIDLARVVSEPDELGGAYDGIGW
ncbi:MAG: UDP-glucose/GDP-mannose dehydrogenase family protein [Chloroflexi bacterium]|nr:UDP-glucose/GDP-mannose dehydrogenase family protein [Chloroflexota bacterium]